MNQPIKTTNKTSGFTLIELMLSMTFVAVLLVTIALTIIQMATVYNRGMTLKEVNQSARDIASDMRRTVSASQVFTVNTDGTDSSDYVTVKSGATVVGGRLCTGKFTYVWNTAKATESPIDGNAARVLNSADLPQGTISLIKVSDADKTYCTKTSGKVPRDITYADSLVMTDLLDAGDHKLGIQKMAVSTNDTSYDASTNQRLYTVNYTIGSGNTSAMNTTQSACLPPGDPDSDLSYCTVQSFSLVLRVGNAVN